MGNLAIDAGVSMQYCVFTPRITISQMSTACPLSNSIGSCRIRYRVPYRSQVSATAQRVGSDRRAGGTGATHGEHRPTRVVCTTDQPVDVGQQAFAAMRTIGIVEHPACMLSESSARFGETVSDITFLLSGRCRRRIEKTPSGTGGACGNR